MEYPVLSEENWDEVKELLTDSFLAREPTCLALHIKPEEIMNLMAFCADYALKSGCSFGARDTESGKLVGFMLNRISLLEHKEMEKSMKWEGTPQEMLFCAVNDRAYEGIDLWEQNEGVDRIFEFFSLTVDPEYKGQGIARKLVELSDQKAVEEGCQLGKVEASNVISKYLWGQLGYETFATLDFQEYNEEKGEDVLDLEAAAPTTGWDCMSKRYDGN